MSLPRIDLYAKPNGLRVCCETVRPLESSFIPSHSSNSAGEENASIVASNFSAPVSDKYTMLSAYWSLDSAPDGDSLAAVIPFQATPLGYDPSSACG